MFVSLVLLTGPALIRAQPYKIKNPATDMYMGLEGKYPTWLPLEKSNTFSEKPSETDGRVIIEVKELPGKVWDIEGSAKNLIFYPEHGSPNQRFLVERADNGIVRLLNDDKCITFVESDNRFEKLPCQEGSENQGFYMADENSVAIGVPPADEEEASYAEDGADQSKSLEMALRAYLGAGGEAGGSSALAAATGAFWGMGGSKGAKGVNADDALLIAIRKYLQSVGVTNASQMNASKGLAEMARVHPAAKEYYEMQSFVSPTASSSMTTTSYSDGLSPGMGMINKYMTGGPLSFFFNSYGRPHSPTAMNLHHKPSPLNLYALTGMGRGSRPSRNPFKSSIFSSGRSWRS